MSNFSENFSPVISRSAENLNAQQAYLFDLSYLSLVRIAGDDANHFLQGQFSNDINLLSDEHPHQLSAYCNPKGRVLAIFDVLKLESGYALIAPVAVLNKVLPRLKMFRMRAAVDIEQAEDIRVLGLRYKPEQHSDILADLHNMGAQTYVHNNDPQRLFVVAAQQAAGELLDGRKPSPQASENQWRHINIQQCLAEVFPETYEAFIPQSINLDLSDGVNFKKGCYPGQEIIARVKYRGKPKTRMIGAQTNGTDHELQIGRPIYIDGRESSAGMVVNFATSNAATCMSITIPVSHLLEGKLYLDEARNIELQRLPCPYKVTV